MKSSFWHLLAIIWLVLLYLFSIWLFAKGFLLYRVVVDRNSSCHNLKESKLLSLYDQDKKFWDNSQPGCWFPPKYKRAVVLLVDGLRYDFAKYNPAESIDARYYQNKLPIIHETLLKKPSNALLYKFTADPPTTTLQRLKALSTGSLPTYIDLSWNFASYYVGEDNLIRQLHGAGKRITIMGDDTWSGLYPNSTFHRSFFYPSFNVKDLHSVDAGIMEHILPELRKPDWDVLIAHFLGVDHCGHRYGPSHPEMASKLTQINGAITQVLKELEGDNETVLFVLGDHGMTRHGDHGGDSEDEVNSALFVYSNQHIGTNFPEIATFDDSIYQIDFVPTLSLLLGVPIPFSNVGKVVTQLFSFPLDCHRVPENAEFTCHDNIPQIKSLWTSIAAVRVNIAQVQRYLFFYHQTSKLLPGSTQRKFDELLEHYDRQWVLLQNLPSDDRDTNIRSLVKLRDNYGLYLSNLKLELDHVWASYDMQSLTGGLVLMVLSLLANFAVVQITSAHPDVPSAYKKIAIGLLMGSTIAFALRLIGIPSYESNQIYDAVFLSALTSILFAAYFGLRAMRDADEKFSARRLLTVDSITLVFLLLQFVGFFSNSSVEEEGLLVYYLLTSYIVVIAAVGLRNAGIGGRRATKASLSVAKRAACVALAALLVLRLTRSLHRCRDEQQTCEESIYLQPILTFAGNEWKAFRTRRVLLSGLALFGPIATTFWFHKKNHLVGESTVASLALKYLVPFAALCVATHWILALVEPVVLQKHLRDNQEVLSKTANVLSGALFALFVVWPIASDKRTFFGRSVNLFSACTLLALALFIPLSLWLGDGASLGLFLMWVLAALVIALLRTLAVDNLWTASYVWFLLSCHGFFVTGHQTAIASLPWSAAFIANEGDFKNYAQAAIQVTGNVFASQILCACTLPLLATYGFGAPQIQPKEDINARVLQIGSIPANLASIILRYLFYNGLRVLGVSLANTFLRRHLMVWKIFAPRFIYEIPCFGVVATCCLIAYCFTLRVGFSFDADARQSRREKTL